MWNIESKDTIILFKKYTVLERGHNSDESGWFINDIKSQSMRILIIANDIKLISFIENEFISLFPYIQIIGPVDSLSKGLRILKQDPTIELCIFDLEADNENSFILNDLCFTQVPVIFIVPDSCSLKNNLKANIVDYLVKPLDLDRLKLTLLKYIETSMQIKPVTNTLLTSIQSGRAPKKIIIGKWRNEFCILKSKQIAYFYFENKVVFAFDSSGTKYIIDVPNLSDLMKYFLDNSLFFRANRQYIINILFLTNYKLVDRVKIQLQLNISVPRPIYIGQTNVREFKKWLNDL